MNVLSQDEDDPWMREEPEISAGSTPSEEEQLNKRSKKSSAPGYCDPDNCLFTSTCKMKEDKLKHVMKLDLSSKCRFFQEKKPDA
ncbi:MAG: hypothetical protein OEZ48_00070 [Candidatus Bathyarchaeota archaeon]|nr:hypothetical protein [Candidatus Bathyarchaeota archaeon]MDH5686251.1 hypothetical protein [Candidatus Bathyarchaeota archaeon]